MSITPDDKWHMESEAVYAAIERGELSGADAVYAAMDEGYLRAYGDQMLPEQGDN